MVDILDEAIQDIKEERVERLFFKYAKVFIMLIVAFLIGSISYYGWKTFKENKIYALGGEYLMGMYRMQSKDFEKGADIMERLAAGDISYSALAGLNYASFLSIKQQFTKAGQIYKMIGDNTDFDPLFREFAKLMQISMRLNAKELDARQGIEEYENYIKNNLIFKASAIEQQAVLYLSLGEKEKAKGMLNTVITSADAPSMMKRRAEELLVLTSL
ncbi:hypothetical protein I862_04595 [endosymbiont of Acanthamoeba sp. UWC8]|uniref:DUF2659 family protein n=1 Tax=endosymbiont of Acanthamoeba sp. UWC8 TaxID=86106 RepID=UPI0004D18093|nr:hypothetical protein [endosymbiont of Acanthamoeba sp. UWC8]AIF81477.1 hypothetical protein I862_04595 [endosymbiont of Acanthamoeba sp. UWC8]